ncbi:Peptidase M15A, C-terminal [uncultured Caudovirales phage]|uniref:Peptidase M15A, C-terminal n=1 Tax=uncultured Caudovirales phage TaxID=2100421 RepID=A0A6J5LR75_9CAUD|nr:Peptidase M15A, C-terminal [uncultured Caudovirales phage]
MNLSPNFTLEELTHTDHRELSNEPNESETANLKRLADFLEQVKTILGGKPIMVNSAFRSKAVNDAVGSKDSSQHRMACAADIRVPGMTPDEVVRALIAAGIGYDQIIREFDRWTHISITNQVGQIPRRQALIIDKAGTRPFA